MKKILFLSVVWLFSCASFAQIVERPRPQEWDNLVEGARFIDRFLPMEGKVLSSDTWGGENVKPRYVDNGIEDNIWSYWGGNIQKGKDGKYHLFVCGWLETSAKGHGEWSNSIVFNTVSDNLNGPYQLKNVIGKGHNPEVFRLKDGRYVLYVIGGRYVADDLNGKWEYGTFDFNPRDRRIIEGLSNLTFAQREDGSYLMICRGGGVWISADGLSEYNQITDKRVYPDVDGRFEDPVVWKDHVQYHMIVNDWLGRIAFYLRSKDGIKWVTDPGEAYTPGISVHKDGLVEDWFKYERIKMYQDDCGRAIQANFAVIDTLKPEDKPYDTHSSKNISIPLNPGVLLTVLNTTPITSKTKTIQVKIQAEEHFNPLTDIDLTSLRFGANSEVNYGKGCRVLKTEASGKDLIVTFNGAGNGITKDEFAPKLIGKRKDGTLLYGYARLPGVSYMEPILSVGAPRFELKNKNGICTVEVQNFGLVASNEATVKVEYLTDKKKVKVGSGRVKALTPYEKENVQLAIQSGLEQGAEYEFVVTVYAKKEELSVFTVKTKIE